MLDCTLVRQRMEWVAWLGRLPEYWLDVSISKRTKYIREDRGNMDRAQGRTDHPLAIIHLTKQNTTDLVSYKYYDQAEFQGCGQMKAKA